MGDETHAKCDKLADRRHFADAVPEWPSRRVSGDQLKVASSPPQHLYRSCCEGPERASTPADRVKYEGRSRERSAKSGCHRGEG